MFEYGPVGFVLLLVLLIFDIFIYGFQAALSSVDDKELERRAEEEKDRKAALIAAYVDQPAKLNQLCGLVATLVHVIMGAGFLSFLLSYSAGQLQPVLQGEIWSTELFGVSLLHILVSIVGTVVFVYLVHTVGILVPCRLAERKPERWAYRCVNLVRFAEILCAPILVLTDITTKGILMLFGVRDEEDNSDVIEQEIIDMVNEGHEQGVIEASEAQMIHKIFEYGDKEAQDIMTNRSHIVAIDVETTLEDAVQFMLEGKNSRYPVIDETIDHIVGILYLKDAMRFYNAGAPKQESIGKVEGLLRKAEYTPLTRNIDDLFETLQSKKLQMAIVIDEYGQTAGLVTMEDILEEIVGKIQDEYDEDEAFIEEKSNDAYVMEGMTPLQDIEEQLDIEFDDTQFETLNGFMIGEMDHIPEQDEDFECIYKGYNFKVLSIENMRVQSVLVQKLPEETAEETELKEE